MNPFWIFVLSLVPGLAWVYYFYRQDPVLEPVQLIFKVFLFGMLAVFPAGIIEAPFHMMLSNPTSTFALFLVSFLVVGVVEESLKFAAAVLAVRHSGEFDQVVDGVIYLVTAALGFAAVENYYYTTAFGISIAPARAIVASLAHASFSGVLGYYWGLGRHSRPFLTVKGWVLAVLLHGLYDFLLLSRIIGTGGAIVGIILLFLFLRSKLRRAIELTEHGS
ncbi:MAG: PrsW family glutamic-type intramembrane protease [Limnochordia bacterium]|nr:PrsW family glutamic-type intramembrane protease [Limnochordia bacterium]MDD2630339.1 PrsW family glutamic-type intramembrane protease [Limnochordia bacterium]MDD4517907.1 PrsW family glutamic-type intramembrane protease [Limnochordia bacterium]